MTNSKLSQNLFDLCKSLPSISYKINYAGAVTSMLQRTNGIGTVTL